MFSAGRVRSATDEVDAWITKPIRAIAPVQSSARAVRKHQSRRGREIHDHASQYDVDEPPPPWRKAVRVLLVDDNLVNRTIGREAAFRARLYRRIAESARRGLEIVSDHGSDIVLMDCEMPEMDGYQAVAEIRPVRRERPAHRVIALTAHATADDRARCLHAGMDDYLSKAR